MTLEGTTEALVVQTLVANYNRSRAGLPKRRKPGARALRRAMTVPSAPSTGRPPSCSLPAMPEALAPRSAPSCRNRRHHRPDPGHNRGELSARRRGRRHRCKGDRRHPLVLHAQASQSGPHLNPASVKQGQPCGARDAYRSSTLSTTRSASIHLDYLTQKEDEQKHS